MPTWTSVGKAKMTGATMTISIWFTSVIELRAEFATSNRKIVKESGKPCEVTLDDVPLNEFEGGRPSGRVLEQAELIFLGKFDEFFPEHHVLAWEARFGSVSGPVLCRYEMHIKSS